MAHDNNTTTKESMSVSSSTADNDDNGKSTTAETAVNHGKTSSATNVQQNTKDRRVTWAAVQLREYPMIPGDNPAAIGGVPVTIHWEHVEEQSVSVDEFESSRTASRSLIEMRMPPRYRNDLLRRLGFSRGDVTAALKAANIARAQRRRTVEMMNLAGVQESLEKVKRATLNVTLRRGKKVQEKRRLQSFCGKTKYGKENATTGYMEKSRTDTIGTAAESLMTVELSDNSEEQRNEAICLNRRRHRNSILIQ